MLNNKDAILSYFVIDLRNRQRWLDCPEGALDLFMSASTSAGEGPPGNVISLQPVDPEGQ